MIVNFISIVIYIIFRGGSINSNKTGYITLMISPILNKREIHDMLTPHR